MFITINPLYEQKEGFGSLMSHYATMHSLSKQLPHLKPTIVKYRFLNETAMQFFDHNKTLYHSDIFLNFDDIMQTISYEEAVFLDWKEADFRNLSYNDILEILQDPIVSQYNIACLWNPIHSFFELFLDDIINYLFVFKPEIIDTAKQLLPQSQKEIVAVCVRNQYKKFACPHKILDLNYYYSAMSFFGRECKFLIFSDFLDETKEMFQHEHNKKFFDRFDIEYTNEMQGGIGMCLMSMCNHIIGANSSFSYWASILNKHTDKKIICPYDFIDTNKNPILAKRINGNYYPKNWISIANT